MNMVEKVARGLCVFHNENPDGQPEYSVQTVVGKGTDTTPVASRKSVKVKASPNWHARRLEAKAAILAMREPTEEMIKCNDEVHWGYSCYICGGLKEGWEAMINAALKE